MLLTAGGSHRRVFRGSWAWWPHTLLLRPDLITGPYAQAQSPVSSPQRAAHCPFPQGVGPRHGCCRRTMPTCTRMRSAESPGSRPQEAASPVPDAAAPARGPGHSCTFLPGPRRATHASTLAPRARGCLCQAGSVPPVAAIPRVPRPGWPSRGSREPPPSTSVLPPQPTTVWPASPQPTPLHRSAGCGPLCMASLAPWPDGPQPPASWCRESPARMPRRPKKSGQSLAQPNTPTGSSICPTLPSGAAVPQPWHQLGRAVQARPALLPGTLWDRPSLPRCGGRRLPTRARWESALLLSSRSPSSQPGPEAPG